MSTGQDGSDEPPVSYSMADLGASLPGVAGLSASDRAGLVNVLKDKLQLLAGQPSGYIESLSPKVKRRVTVLQEIQSQHDELKARFFEEKAALEAKYQKLYEPLYNKRYGIVNGVVEVEANKDETPETDAAAPDNSSEEKGVPEFWLTAMKTNEILGMQITERDEGALKYLKDLKSSNLEDTKGFKIDFYFDENPFFKNKVLTKTYYMVDEEEPILERATGTEIEWYPGKNLTQKLLKKKPKKGAKNAKPVTKTEECESFFNFFYPPKIPEDEDDIDQDTAEQLQDLMEQDYDVGSTIKEKLIPHAVSWFTGEALQGEEFEDDEDDEDEGDEEEEDDEDEEEEDEDEEGDLRKRAAPKLKVRMKNHPPQQEAGEQPAECKQQ